MNREEETALPSSSKRPKAVLMRADDIIDIKRAADFARRSDKTIRHWVKNYGIGRQASPCAPIEVSLVALSMVLHGDMEALELLRNGERSHPDVLRFIREVGVPQ